MMTKLILGNSIKFNEDIYIMRNRPSYHEVLVNGGYKQIHIIDYISGGVKKSITFPDSVECFSIHSWLTSPDGAKSYLLTTDDLGKNNYAIEIEHIKETSQVIYMPPSFDMHGEFYYFSDQLYLISRTNNNLILKKNSFVSYDNNNHLQKLKVQVQNLEKKIGPLNKYNILKMDMNNQGLYLFGGEPLMIGYASLDGKEVLTTDIDWKCIDISRSNNTLFLCYEDKIIIKTKNKSQVILEANSNEYYTSINTFQKNHTTYLNVLCSYEKDPEISWLKTYYYTETKGRL